LILYRIVSKTKTNQTVTTILVVRIISCQFVELSAHIALCILLIALL